jgi:hypothetical protein
MRDRLLMTLAVNRRPLYVAELSQLLRSDEKNVRRTLAVLIRCGLVVRDRTSRSGRFVSLNLAFPAYHELVMLLRALERHWPQPRASKKPVRRAERLLLSSAKALCNAGPFGGRESDLVFYSRVRTRTLLAITAARNTDVTDLHFTFGEDKRSVWNAVNHWQREGVVRSAIVGRRRSLELDPSYPAARELRLFLRALNRMCTEYPRLARFSIRDPKSARFVAWR